MKTMQRYVFVVMYLACISDNILQSEEELTLAFYQCHTGAQSNQECDSLLLVSFPA